MGLCYFLLEGNSTQGKGFTWEERLYATVPIFGFPFFFNNILPEIMKNHDWDWAACLNHI